MTEREATDLAGRALPCPFCGERLIAKGDHHGWWVGHRDEPGPCFDSVAQLMGEGDLEGWNRRAGQMHFLEAVRISTLDPEQKDEWAQTCLWEAVNEYAAACGGDTGEATVGGRRMDAVAAVERVVELIAGIRHAHKATIQAEFNAALERDYRSDGPTVSPDWVNEARRYRRHGEGNVPWLDDLLKALGWDAGTVHDALNAVARLVAADDARQR